MDENVEENEPSPDARPKIAIVGAGGRLGAALQREYASTADITAFNRQQLDLADGASLRAKLGAASFDFLINSAAQTNVDRCEAKPEEAFALNAEAPGVLAEICTAKKARLIHISTDYVFDGEKREAYSEEDEARPISVYGESKREGERRVLAVDPNHLVVRVSWVFGPDRPSFVDWIIEQARKHDHVEAIADKISAPTYTLDIAKMLRPFWSSHSRALGAGGGMIHLANRGECSWQEYGQWALDCCRAESVALRARAVGAIALRDMKSFIARRPIYTVLATEKYQKLAEKAPRDWHDAVEEYVRVHVAPGFARQS